MPRLVRAVHELPAVIERTGMIVACTRTGLGGSPAENPAS
jgi:hypothetical protein